MGDPIMPKLIDEDSAYQAMGLFLEAYWQRGDRASDDLAVLLGSLRIDPAMRSDWQEAIGKATVKDR
jgi:hypothetical protein